MLMLNKIIKNFQWGKHKVTLETGEIARQASGAVLVSMEETIILATVVVQEQIKINQYFLPLTVDYIEKTYSAGKIPGSFFRREGRPSENEILVSRLIDRSIRPLFPDSFYNEVQVIIHVLSVNPEIPPDIPSIIGASAALAISGVPFNGPIGAAHVGLINDQYVLNLTRTQLKHSKLNLTVAGTEHAILMVEAEANQLSEDIILDSIVYGHKHMQVVIDSINYLVEHSGKPEWQWEPILHNEELINKIKHLAEPKLREAYNIYSTKERNVRFNEIENEILKYLNDSGSSTLLIDPILLSNLLFQLRSNIIRSQILIGEPRIDGRDTRTVRPIEIRTNILPRTHGSALFTRGDTQALVVTTLGTTRDEQVIDSLEGEYREHFILHYNMPPFATGETGRISISPKRREIGHGRLAKRALTACLPTFEEFSYTIRLVSEITESNGSSSMATICSACLALLDAGVPIKEQVAGIAMGLILEDNKFSVLTDISGEEDHLGDMDFKVAGTRNGITALQMDIKTQGITKEIMQVALAQAREGIIHILNCMYKIVPSRNELSMYAPRVIKMKIPSDKIRDVIGKGGSVIRALTEATSTTIDITDEGIVAITGTNKENIEHAKRRIEQLTLVIVPGQIYEGTVVKILDFGAIINVLPGKDGLLHISEIVNGRVNDVKDYLKEGQLARVKVLAMDEKGRIRLSTKALLEETGN